MSDSQNKDLSQPVMQQIHDQKIKMKPKIYFIFGSFILGVGLAIALVIAAFFINLFFFRLSFAGPFGFLLFGRLGLGAFLVNFPWFAFFLALAAIFGGLKLLQRYDFAYQKNFLSIVVGLVAFVLTLGFILNRSGVNQKIRHHPPLRPFYQNQFSGKDWLVGEIIQINNGQMLILIPEEREVVLVRDHKTFIPPRVNLEVGDHIRAIGQWQGDVFRAIGITESRLPGWLLQGDVQGFRRFRRP